MMKRYVIRLVGFIAGLSILFSLLLFSSEAAQEESESFYHESWALLVGINKYPNLPPEFQLNYAVNDAEEFAKLLSEEFGFLKENIKVLKDKDATKENILYHLSNLADTKRIAKEDRVLIFFSGHGQTISLPTGGEMGFLIPYDAKVDMQDVENPAQYSRTCIGMDVLKSHSALIPAKHVLFLIDACYSGLAVGSSKGFDFKTPGLLQKVSKLPVRHIITAGRRNEQALENSTWGHGAFTYKLLEALKTGVSDWNNDSVTTGKELATYLYNVVSTLTNGKQTPADGRFAGEGEFLFVHDTIDVDKEPPHLDLIAPPEIRGKDRDLLIKSTGKPIKIVGFASDNVGVEQVLVDGQKVSFASVTNENKRGFQVVEIPDDRKVRFEVEIPASSKKSREVEIQAIDAAGNQASVLLRIIPAGKGTLLVNTKPIGAKIYIDGEFIAHTPKVINNLPAGQRHIRLILDTHEYEKVITIRADSTEKLSHAW